MNKKRITIVTIISILVVGMVLLGFWFSRDNLYKVWKITNGDFYGCSEYINADKDEFIKRMAETYSMNRKQAEEIYLNKNDYAEISVGCDIVNKSFLPMFIVNTFSCNKMTAYVDNELQEAQDLCYLEKGESTYIVTSFIVEKEHLNEDFLKNLKIYVFSIGLPVISSVKFDGYYHISDIDADDWDEYIKENSEDDDLKREKEFYRPVISDGEELTCAEYDFISYSESRIIPGGTYRVSKFIYNKELYTCFVFFDKNGFFEGGMAINEILPSDKKQEFYAKKESKEELKQLSQTEVLYKLDDSVVSYHYFDDNSCIECMYNDDMQIESIREIDVSYMVNELQSSDYEYVECNTGDDSLC